MHPEIKENFREKLRLTVADTVSNLDIDIKAMLAKHAAEGMLRSGNTIKKAMDLIAEGNARILQETLEHVNSLNLTYYPEIESDIQGLAKSAQESFKAEVLPRFKKSTETAGKPQLYERMLHKVESGMANDLAKFQNQLNVTCVHLKLNNTMSPTEKFLWGFEGILLLVSMFIAGMWYKDPAGNYEPVLVGLGLVIPILAIGIKFGAKK